MKSNPSRGHLGFMLLQESNYRSRKSYMFIRGGLSCKLYGACGGWLLTPVCWDSVEVVIWKRAAPHTSEGSSGREWERNQPCWLLPDNPRCGYRGRCWIRVPFLPSHPVLLPVSLSEQRVIWESFPFNNTILEAFKNMTKYLLWMINGQIGDGTGWFLAIPSTCMISCASLSFKILFWLEQQKNFNCVFLLCFCIYFFVCVTIATFTLIKKL